MSKRLEIADFWDDYIHQWIKGDAHLENWIGLQSLDLQDKLRRWKKAYSGKGVGAVDQTALPDPFYGDIRGEIHHIQFVFLGLNPGIAYPGLQSREGVWTNRVRTSGFSRCYDRIPWKDPDWIRLHGKESKYWVCLRNFAERLYGKTIRKENILNLELFPWHSPRISGKLEVDSDVVKTFVFDPLAEVSTDFIFAFGRPWWDVCKMLGFEVESHYGDGQAPFPGPSSKGWNVVICTHVQLRARLVINWQPGNGNPPAGERLKTFKSILAQSAYHSMLSQ
ncbi:hypothetical protein KQ306_12340 [Synechococcus sp. CS-1324]|uniref:anti-phage DNA glycosylase Brig1 n=1 Tax=Synechococcus sp. CS-1324 TaxID=2847980 RepID=UPI00223BADAA|nr:hypothetical protein [Synechococcus sp. CS-1324]MCT0231635.1 hypothetical protein [Synechococcus sp. CS-1324]